MTMLSPEHLLEALTVDGFQAATDGSGLRLESFDSALLASMLESSLDGFLLFDDQLCCLFANQAICQILGRSSETICGRPLPSLFADGRHEARFMIGTGHWPAVVVRANGEKCEVECTQAIIEQGGKIQGVLMVRDLTDARPATREAHILRQLTTSIVYTRPLESILATLARDVVQMLDIPACFITLVSGSPPQFRVLSDYGLPPGFTATMRDLAQVGARLPTLYAFQKSRIVLHNFPANDAFYTRLFPQRHWSSEVDALLHRFLELRLQFPGGNIVSVPLRYRGATLGVFNAYYPLAAPPDLADLSLFTSIAELTAVAIHNAREFGAAQERAALEERRRLARELHDSVSQQLYGVALGVQSARHFIETDPPYATEALDYALSLARACQADMRALLFVLHPKELESAGLVEALTRHALAVGSRNDLAVELDLCVEPDMPFDSKEALYRIAQEALHNAVKHAQARRIMLHLSQVGTNIVLQIEDDGVGFDSTATFPGHLGLQSMQERAQRLGGAIEIKSVHARGTSILVSLPLLKTSNVLPAPPPKEGA